MKFGAVPVAEAEGAVLAHSITLPSGKLRKGLILGAGHLMKLTDAGVNDVVVARLEAGDVHEDAAAEQLAQALVPDPAAVHLRVTDAFTGRVNLIADREGVVVLDVAALEAFNDIHPMITIATVPPLQQMAPGGMVATIKIISYGVAAQDVQAAADAARNSIALAAPVMTSAGLVITDIPGGSSNEKGQRAIEDRIRALGMEMADIRVVPHDVDALAQALRQLDGDIALILTGSATSDIADVAPEAVRQAGGTVDRFGMPVDPGNLLFLGSQQQRPVIGLPGCARSPALNGADWVLSRVACGIEVSARDIAAMGVGGLLKEIPSRPQPRAGRAKS